MTSSLSSLTNNLAKGLYKATYKDFKPSLEYTAVKNGLMICKYVGYYKTFEKTFHGNLVKIFRNTYRFCNRDLKRILSYIANSCLSIWRHWWLGKIHWKVITHKEGIYSNLTMESIIDDDYKHAKLIWEEFRSQKQGQYHELYVESCLHMNSKNLETNA